MHVSRSEALLHPVRLRIVLILAARSNLTAQEIGRFLDDVPQATLYRHLNNLREADIIRVVEERPTGGSLERVYALNEGATYLSPADLERATKDDHMRYFTTFCVHLLGLFGTYLRRERIDLARDGVGYQTHVMHLSPEELAQFVGELRQLMLSYMSKEPSPQRSPHTFTTILIPDDRLRDGPHPDAGPPHDADVHERPSEVDV